jgi:hypothetical protein
VTLAQNSTRAGKSVRLAVGNVQNIRHQRISSNLNNSTAVQLGVILRPNRLVLDTNGSGYRLQRTPVVRIEIPTHRQRSVRHSLSQTHPHPRDLHNTADYQNPTHTATMQIHILDYVILLATP